MNEFDERPHTNPEAHTLEQQIKGVSPEDEEKRRRDDVFQFTLQVLQKLNPDLHPDRIRELFLSGGNPMTISYFQDQHSYVDKLIKKSSWEKIDNPHHAWELKGLIDVLNIATFYQRHPEAVIPERVMVPEVYEDLEKNLNADGKTLIVMRDFVPVRQVKGTDSSKIQGKAEYEWMSDMSFPLKKSSVVKKGWFSRETIEEELSRPDIYLSGINSGQYYHVDFSLSGVDNLILAGISGQTDSYIKKVNLKCDGICVIMPNSDIGNTWHPTVSSLVSNGDIEQLGGVVSAENISCRNYFQLGGSIIRRDNTSGSKIRINCSGEFKSEGGVVPDDIEVEIVDSHLAERKAEKERKLLRAENGHQEPQIPVLPAHDDTAKSDARATVQRVTEDVQAFLKTHPREEEPVETVDLGSKTRKEHLANFDIAYTPDFRGEREESDGSKTLVCTYMLKTNSRDSESLKAIGAFMHHAVTAGWRIVNQEKVETGYTEITSLITLERNVAGDKKEGATIDHNL